MSYNYFVYIHTCVDHLKVGWTCPACTLINEPHHSTCEVCGTACPEDYKPTNEEISLQEEVNVFCATSLLGVCRCYSSSSLNNKVNHSLISSFIDKIYSNRTVKQFNRMVIYYRTEEKLGSKKLWRIWRISKNSPKFFSPTFKVIMSTILQHTGTLQRKGVN